MTIKVNVNLIVATQKSFQEKKTLEYPIVAATQRSIQEKKTLEYLIVATQRSIQEKRTKEYLTERRVGGKKMSKTKILFRVEDNQVDVIKRMMKVMRGINSMILRDHIVKRVQEIKAFRMRI